MTVVNTTILFYTLGIFPTTNTCETKETKNLLYIHIYLAVHTFVNLCMVPVWWLLWPACGYFRAFSCYCYDILVKFLVHALTHVGDMACATRMTHVIASTVGLETTVQSDYVPMEFRLCRQGRRITILMETIWTQVCNKW